ncbi:unnamed protein product [Ilex paraguariensis]|uniref:Ribosomal protein L19 n=1 Tax=Ilex paraguariensis TaxID=185542 RepID=A0ABC8R6X9_9AQUA
MQSLCGRVRLVTRHTVDSSKYVDFKPTRASPIVIDRGLSSLELNSFVLNGVAVANNFYGYSVNYFMGYSLQLPPKFASCSHPKICTKTDLLGLSMNNRVASVALFHGVPRPCVFQFSTRLPTCPSRCITTTGYSVESISQDTSSSMSDVVPRLKFKRLDKTARHIMQILDKEAVEEVRVKREIPDIRPGYIIQLKVEVPENKRRVSILKGIVIARRNAGLNTTLRLRRLVAEVGVESLFPLYSPNIKEIKVLDKKKVRRAKLYYLRD